LPQRGTARPGCAKKPAAMDTSGDWIVTGLGIPPRKCRANGVHMNQDTLEGEGRNLGGKIKEAVGTATGDETVRNQGVADQVTGNLQQSYGAARDAVVQGVGPLADKAKAFARERPWAAAALAGTIALAVFNTLRGKRP